MKENGLDAWETNAYFWDEQMGDESNDFHREIVRPYVEKLLGLTDDDLVLDIACGNGNFSSRMAERGVQVTAFDYSPKMIELAKARRANVLDKVSFHVCDATDYEKLISLKGDRPFSKAVANMAIMDIAEIEPLFRAVFDMLAHDGCFVFATHHPSFTFPNDDYFTPCMHKGFAFPTQPVLHNYYHRSITEILNVAFQCGFSVTGFHEVPFSEDKTPIIMTVRLQKKR